MARLGGIATTRIPAKYLSSSSESRELKICFDMLVAFIAPPLAQITPKLAVPRSCVGSFVRSPKMGLKYPVPAGEI